jgi:hypothetical protein
LFLSVGALDTKTAFCGVFERKKCATMAPAFSRLGNPTPLASRQLAPSISLAVQWKFHFAK